MANKKLGIFILVATILVLNTSVTPSYVSNYDVGGANGWNVGFDFNEWAKTQEFIIDDKLRFKYPKGKYDVVEVDQASYESCKVPNPSPPALTSGDDIYAITTAGKKYFICSKEDGKFCKEGLKMVIEVAPPFAPKKQTSKLQSSNSESPVEFVVGDGKGWGVEGVSYQDWAQGKEFSLGDTLLFKYEVGKSNVFKVDEASFKECKIPGEDEAMASGKDAVSLDSVGGNWFISGVGGQCEKGVKLMISVIGPYSKKPKLQGARKLVPSKL